MVTILMVIKFSQKLTAVNCFLANFVFNNFYIMHLNFYVWVSEILGIFILFFKHAKRERLPFYSNSRHWTSARNLTVQRSFFSKSLMFVVLWAGYKGLCGTQKAEFFPDFGFFRFGKKSQYSTIFCIMSGIIKNL